MEYLSLAFNHETYLVGLSGVPNYQITLWDWPKEERLHTVDTHIRVVHFNHIFILSKYIFIEKISYLKGPTNLAFSPNTGTGPARLLLAEPLQEQRHREGKGDLVVWRIKRCGDDTRLAQEFLPSEFRANNHVATTWGFPNNLYVIHRDGTISKVLN